MITSLDRSDVSEGKYAEWRRKRKWKRKLKRKRKRRRVFRKKTYERKRNAKKEMKIERAKKMWRKTEMDFEKDVAKKRKKFEEVSGRKDCQDKT